MDQLTDEMIARVPGIWRCQTWCGFHGSDDADMWCCKLNSLHGSGHTRQAAMIDAFVQWYRRFHGVTDLDLSEHIPAMVATIRDCQPA